ncbi:carbamoylphosphate synthase large subunit [Xylariales sp. AK1849]|nr:carbamoylphosphate synthase large subunit [Xylariales sp. AK1849]
MARTFLSEGVRSLILILISIFFLPVSSALSIFSVLTQVRVSPLRLTNIGRSIDTSQRRRILVTGVGMAKGLTLARAFYLSGHHVIGADFENSGIPCSGRYSKSLSKFHRLENPDSKDGNARYIRQILDLIETEATDLWVSCSGVATAMQDAEAKEAIEKQTSCKCIQFGVQETSRLHEKDAFMHEAERLGLPVPQTHHVASHDDVLGLLADTQVSHPERKFILKTIGVDDANRGNMTLLPLSTTEETRAHVTRLAISPSQPWILQEFIPGGKEYCTHALVVRGHVKCFVACPSAELLMHYQPLPRTSALSQSMLAFTREFVFRSEEPTSLTGHLSFDFMVKNSATDERIIEQSIYAIECNPRAHTAVVLFAQAGKQMSAMVEAYLSALDGRSGEDMMHSSMSRPNGTKDDLVITPPDTLSRYWLGHDLVSLVLLPALHFSVGTDSLGSFISSNVEFITHLLTWKEGTFELWDPLPALVLYHIFWPLTILLAWCCGRRWSRVNVSTTKMFMC